MNSGKLGHFFDSMSKVKNQHKKKNILNLDDLQCLVLTSCVWLSRISWSLGDSGVLHAVKRVCPVQVSRLRLECPRAVREKVTVRASRFPWTNASSPKTSKHTLPNTSSFQSMTVWQIESGKFPGASEDARWRRISVRHCPGIDSPSADACVSKRSELPTSTAYHSESAGWIHFAARA